MKGDRHGLSLTTGGFETARSRKPASAAELANREATRAQALAVLEERDALDIAAILGLLEADPEPEPVLASPWPTQVCQRPGCEKGFTSDPARGQQYCSRMCASNDVGRRRREVQQLDEES